MKWIASIIVCLSAGLAIAGGDDDKINEIVEQLGKVEYAHQYSKQYRSLFAAAGPDGLSHLLTLDDDSIAVQSAWESVALTVPIEQDSKVYRPDADELSWFLGFIEGRARIIPPDWWQEAVLDARANRRHNIYPGKPKAVPYHRAGLEWVHCPRNASVETNGDSIVYRVGEDKIAVPEELLGRADDGGLRSSLYGMSGSFTDKYCFLAVHGDGGYRHDIACIERSSEKLVWKSKACGCWWGSSSGFSESWVSLVPTSDNRVFVFGAASIGFYLHGFRASDGKSLIHFSNNY